MQGEVHHRNADRRIRHEPRGEGGQQGEEGDPPWPEPKHPRGDGREASHWLRGTWASLSDELRRGAHCRGGLYGEVDPRNKRRTAKGPGDVALPLPFLHGSEGIGSNVADAVHGEVSARAARGEAWPALVDGDRWPRAAAVEPRQDLLA